MKWRYVALTAAVYVVTTLPYAYGYLRQSADRRFTGVVFDVVDTAQYYAWMRAFSHSPLIANPLTPDAGSERFFNLQWWLLGVVSGGSPVAATIAFQGLRIIALAAFAWMVARLCSLVAGRHAFFAFAMVMLSSGLGWMLVVAKQFTGDLRWPLSVQIAESNTWFSAMAFPHLLVAAALILAIYLLFLQAVERATIRVRFSWAPPRPTVFRLIAIAGLALALGFSHGYDLIPVVVVPGVFACGQLIRLRRLPASSWPAAAICVGAALPVLYTLSLTTLDPTWKGVLSQYGNAGVYTPPPQQLIILLGLPLLLAIPRVRPTEWKLAPPAGQFVRCWFVVGFALLYIPTDYQVKMLTGWQIPVGLLAAETLVRVARDISVRRPALSRPSLLRAAPVVVLGLFFLTNAYLTAWRVVDLRRTDYPYYLTGGDVRALKSLDRPSADGDVVLSSPDLGVWVPVYSDARPYVAHWAQTLRFLERRDAAAWFFDPATSDANRAAFLSENDISIVLSGPAEASIGGGMDPPRLTLDRIFDGATSVYATLIGQAKQ